MVYPYLKEKVVLVEGPSAYGVYDLNAGAFFRVNKSAGSLLSNVKGTKRFDSFESVEREFLEECDKSGIIGWQPLEQGRETTKLADVIRPIRPVRFAWIELTSKCNQLCKHCFLGSDLNAFPHYAKDEIADILATLSRVGARQIILSGGEPTAHPDFLQILDHAGSEYPFKLSLLTNGSHPRLSSAADLLYKYNVTVKISILGWGNVHDQMAGLHGGFARTLETIDVLIAKGVRVELGTTVTGLNHKEIPRIRDYATRIGVPLEVSPLYAIGYALTNSAELYSISQKDIVSICKTDKNSDLVQLSPPELLNRVSPQSQRYEIDPTDYESVNLKDYLTAHSECGQKIVAILSSREVTPCLMLREKKFSLGSLNEFSLEEILSHETPDSARFDELMKLANIPGCSECEARFVCKAGGCPASAKAFAGTVQAKNPLFNECYYVDSHMRSEVGLSPI